MEVVGPDRPRRNGIAPRRTRAAGDGTRRAFPVPRRSTPVERDLCELQRLVRILERHRPDTDDRDLVSLGEHVPGGQAVLHLRAVTALLVTLATYRRSTGRSSSSHGRRPSSPTVGDRGADVADAGWDGSAATGAAVDPALAAATAMYIARDLAARQLTEFTSAEGYRLARALASVGGVRATVDRMLADANTVRLHPEPLSDALSHRPG